MIQKGLETERERIAPKCSIWSNVDRPKVRLRFSGTVYARGRVRPARIRLASSDRRIS